MKESFITFLFQMGIWVFKGQIKVDMGPFSFPIEFYDILTEIGGNDWRKAVDIPFEDSVEFTAEVSMQRCCSD